MERPAASERSKAETSCRDCYVERSAEPFAIEADSPQLRENRDERRINAMTLSLNGRLVGTGRRVVRATCGTCSISGTVVGRLGGSICAVGSVRVRRKHADVVKGINRRRRCAATSQRLLLRRRSTVPKITAFCSGGFIDGVLEARIAFEVASKIFPSAHFLQRDVANASCLHFRFVACGPW